MMALVARSSVVTNVALVIGLSVVTARAAEPRPLLEVGRDYVETRLFSVCRVRAVADAPPLLAVAGFSNDGHGDVTDLAVYELAPDAAIVRWRMLRGQAAASSIRTVRAADLDGDGGDELIGLGRIGNEEVDSRGELQVFQWHVDRWETVAAERWQSGEYTHGYGMDVADVDGDGRPEIVTGGFFLHDGRDQAELRIWKLADRQLTLQTRATWGAENGHTRVNAVCIGDLDADGRVEIVTAGRTGQVQPEEHVTTEEADQIIAWRLEANELRRLATYVGDAKSRSRFRELKLIDIDHRPGLELLAVGRQAPLSSGRRGRGTGGGRGDGSGGGRGDGSGDGQRHASASPALRPLFSVFQWHGDQFVRTADADCGDTLGETRDVAVARDAAGELAILTITADDLQPHRQARLDAWTFADGSLISRAHQTASFGDETRARQLMLWEDTESSRVLTIGFVKRGDQILGQILDWGPVPADAAAE